MDAPVVYQDAVGINQTNPAVENTLTPVSAMRTTRDLR